MARPTDAGRPRPAVQWLAAALVAIVLVASPACAGDEREYLSRKAFLAEAFPATAPVAGKLRIDPALGDRLAAIYRQPFRMRQVRYWQSGRRTAWEIDAIGKEQPITIGVVVDESRLVSVAVLVYREGHGMEVADPAFTAQFAGATRVERQQLADMLDRDIDNITGATLSVRAVTRTARAALLLDAWLHGAHGSAP